jgi:C-terminal processing protease CtpA/Prc
MDRIDRLVCLAKLWCAVKFFHPLLAHRDDIDWDAALIAAIPKVRAAASKDTYAAAIQDMLAALADPATRVREHGERRPRGVGERPPFSRKTDDGALIVALGPDETLDWIAALEEVHGLNNDLAEAIGVVFDLRGSTFAPFVFEWTGLDRRLSRTPLVAPSQRSRVHVGFAPQVGATSGDYHSALQTEDSQSFEPHETARNIPCVFLIDDSSRLPAIALAMQRTGKAAVMMEGEASEAAAIDTRIIDIGDGFNAQVRVSEIVDADGSGGFTPDLVLARAHNAKRDVLLQAALAWLRDPTVRPCERKTLPAAARPARERAYAETDYPSLEYRLLAAFRIWGVIDLFFPYKHLIGEDWMSVLREFIPRFEAAADATGYALAVANMITRTRDSHCNVGSSRLREYFGAATPAARVRIIEGVPVVTRLYDEAAVAAGLAVGDIVLAVDGEEAKARMERLGRYLAASTPQALELAVAFFFLCGPDGNAAMLTVSDGSGKPRDVKLDRASGNWARIAEQRDGETVRMLPGNIGYADLDRLSQSAVDDMFDRFKDTKAIIFDVRGYPKGTGWKIAPRLTEERNVGGALLERPIVTPEALAGDERAGGTTVQSFIQVLPATDKWRYTGRTVMLIDENAFSQAEHTGLFFKAANGTLFVGSPTVGANGDVTNFVVPGDIVIGFSGQAVKHADGRQLQRIGLIPDVDVRPSIAGIRAGRDEVLEKAIEVIEAGAG